MSYGGGSLECVFTAKDKNITWGKVRFWEIIFCVIFSQRPSTIYALNSKWKQALTECDAFLTAR